MDENLSSTTDSLDQLQLNDKYGSGTTSTKIIKNLESLKKKIKRTPNIDPDGKYYLFLRDKSSSYVLQKIKDFEQHLEPSDGLLEREFYIPSSAKSLSEYNNQFKCKLLRRASALDIVVVDTEDRYKHMVTAMKFIRNLLEAGMTITKRGFYYAGEKVYKKDTACYLAIRDICLMFGVTMNSLNIYAAATKGKIIGDVVLKVNYDEEGLNCANQIQSIPQFKTFEGCELKKKVLFLLIVESEAAFQWLVKSKFHENYKCIMITGSGMPDMNTRYLAKEIKEIHELPVFGIFDFDPAGMRIMSVYAFGSNNAPYENHNSVLRNLNWLGVEVKYLDFLTIHDCMKTLTGLDKTKIMNLRKEPFAKSNKKWCKQLGKMLAKGKKASIFASVSIDINYLTDVYLPKQLEEKTWVAI